MKSRPAFLVAVTTALLLAPTAFAHIGISPETVPPDSTARFSIEVPTERKVPTVKLEVKLPRGLEDVQPVAKLEWKVTNQNGVLIWSGGRIAPDQSETFVFKAHVPDAPGKELVFPAIQTYAIGPVERWIFGPGSETPAPRVMVESPVIPIGTATLDKGSNGHRGIAPAIGVALVGGLLALGVALIRRRRA